MQDRIRALAAQKRRIETKQAVFLERVRTLNTDLTEAFGGATVEGVSVDVTLDEYGPDEYVYGHLSYREGELTVCYRTTDEDHRGHAYGVGDHDRVYTVRSLASCTLQWLECLLTD